MLMLVGPGKGLACVGVCLVVDLWLELSAGCIHQLDNSEADLDGERPRYHRGMLPRSLRGCRVWRVGPEIVPEGTHDGVCV